MPFGAHEAMEVHEILMEKINMITHFNIYANETNNPQLLDIIIRHQQEEIRSYNEFVAYTHDYKTFVPIPPNTEVRGISPQQIQYGMNTQAEFTPQYGTVNSDREITTAMLLCHKNAARNGMWAALECADPNLRKMLINSATNCANQAYEVFLFMNEQGLYPVPTLNDNTAKTLLHRYQPADRALEVQYFGQNTGYTGQNYGNAGQGTGSAGQFSGYPGQTMANGVQPAYGTSPSYPFAYGNPVAGTFGTSASASQGTYRTQTGTYGASASTLSDTYGTQAGTYGVSASVSPASYGTAGYASGDVSGAGGQAASNDINVSNSESVIYGNGTQEMGSSATDSAAEQEGTASQDNNTAR
ncbi:coat F domain protein [Bacillus sp. M6-12]|uniref:spore coat protein n=1 Tax=Bacillus sp. M6-12 TaxID=2054166 RepID=UPI000C7685B1|nr:spore coat protein [Bacillus sp. M6-12]PLS17982.1 coat F domain protein [Bacillus sp. M6-12]